MPSWGDTLLEVNQAITEGRSDALDFVRRKYIVQLYQKTNRAVISYSTRWVQPFPGLDPQLLSLTIADIQGLMEVMKGVKEDCVDLILHSPGGALDATEPFVTYLRTKFRHVRVIVPHAAMSAAAMISCSADEIVMGKHSFLGPIDPQFVLQTAVGTRMVPAQAIIEQFKMAQRECAADPSKLSSWISMLNQYGPDLLIQCQNASDLSKTLVQDWLGKYMFPGNVVVAKQIASWLSTHDNFKTHSRYLSRDKLEQQGLKIIKLEEDQDLQDLVLSIHHTTTHTFNNSPTAKIIENHLGKAVIQHAGQPTVNLPLNMQAMIFEGLLNQQGTPPMPRD